MRKKKDNSLKKVCVKCKEPKNIIEYLFLGETQEDKCTYCSDNKLCGNCGIVKLKENGFNIKRGSKCNYSSYCKQCNIIIKRNSRLRDERTCNICHIKKPKDQMRSEYASCLDCFSILLSNPRICNTCNILKQPDDFEPSKLKVCRLCRLNYQNHRRRFDDNFRLKELLRDIFRRENIERGSMRTLELINDDEDFILEWLEFRSCYTLNIRSEDTHIDHVIPISQVRYGENYNRVRELSNWRNLRLCPSAENLNKGNKIDEDLILIQRLMVFEFLRKKLTYNLNRIDI